jgi:hypothetical protein
VIESFDGAKVLAEFAASGPRPDELEDLLRSAKAGHDGIGAFIPGHALEANAFYAGQLEGRGLPASRLDELYDGAQPTPAELELWREAVREQVTNGDDGPWYMALFWRLTGRDGVDVYAVTLQEDGGTWPYVFGPFAAAETALTDLSARGEIHKLDWPPYDSRS